MSLVFAFAAAVAVAGGADSGKPLPGLGKLKAFVPTELLSAIEQNPSSSYDVIVQGDKAGNSNGLYKQITGDKGPAGANASQVREQFNSINGLQATLTGRQIAFLANRPYVTSIMANESVKTSGVQLPVTNSQLWPWATGAPVDW
jgi:hypothetical protein